MDAARDPQREAEMREDFERWISESGRGHMLDRCPDKGWYINLETYGRWCSFEKGWQGATRRASASAIDGPTLTALIAPQLERAFIDGMEKGAEAMLTRLAAKIPADMIRAALAAAPEEKEATK